MTLDEMKAKIASIIGLVTPESQATASEILTELTVESERLYTEIAAVNTSISELAAANEKLREANTNLFLQVGTTKAKEEETTEEETTEEETPTFDDLFDEKGDLK